MTSISNAQLFDTAGASHLKLSPPGVAQCSYICTTRHCKYINRLSRLGECLQGHRNFTALVKASSGNGGASLNNDDDDGVSLGTMKLPLDTDLARFETLLFQWANSLCQGANIPLPMPLKVDKIPGGARLGFITVGDGQTEVLVYIDCLVFPATDGSAPMFRATRNGPQKDKAPPGEPRIMRSLLGALQKSVEIARL